MKKSAALWAYALFMKKASVAAKFLDSDKGSDLPPEVRGAGVGALSGGVPSAALGALLGRGGLKSRLLLAALMGGGGALTGGLLGAGAGALGRAATKPEDKDRLTGKDPIARGALLGATGLGGVGGGLGGAFGAAIQSLGGVKPSLGQKLKGGLSGAAALGIPAALLGGGLGAGAGALRKALSKKDKED